MNQPKRHAVLVVGAGSIGERHLRCFQSTGRAEVSVCDVDSKILVKIQSQYAPRALFTDFDEALRSQPDAIVVATPAHLHIGMSLAAAHGGHHMLIEKPLSTGTTDVDHLCDLVAEKNLAAMVAYVLRSHPALTSMRQAINANRFGRPLHVYATCGQHFPTYRPAYREIYYRDRVTGGGAIQDALTHVVNAAEWLVGPIDRLAADAAHQRLEGVQVEDTVNVIGRHGNVLASYVCNQHQAPNELTLTVVCEQGTARFEYHDACWRWMLEPESGWHVEPTNGLQRDAIFVRQANAFLDAIELKCKPPCTLDEGRRTLHANLAILHAIDNHTWVTVAD